MPAAPPSPPASSPLRDAATSSESPSQGASNSSARSSAAQNSTDPSTTDASTSDPSPEDPDSFATLPMDEEWLNDESTLLPPDCNSDDDFRFSFTIVPQLRNYLNAKRPKGKAKVAPGDPYSSTAPEPKPQRVKCNSVSELRTILYRRYARGLIGRAVSDNMDTMLIAAKDRTSADVISGWRLEPVTVVDLTNYFYFKQSGHLYFFVGTERPAWFTSNNNYYAVNNDFLVKLHEDGKDVKINIARLGFHLQIKADYEDFVKAVRAPQNTDRAGFTAQVDINAIIKEMQAAHPNFSRQPPSSWQQGAAEVAALPRDRHARAIQNGPPSTLPFVQVESEAERQLANAYESNIFLQHVTEGAGNEPVCCANEDLPVIVNDD